MKKKSIIPIILGSLALIFSITSCTENIDNISLGTTDTKIVVEGYISTDTTRQMVKLSKLGDALNKAPGSIVSDAVVTISDGTEVFSLKEDLKQKGTYYTDSTVYGVPGRTYTLNISHVDINDDGTMETYTAKSLMKPINPIDSFHLVYNNANPNMKGWSVNLFAQDPGGGRNFYLIKVRKDSVMLTDSIFKYSVADNTGFQGGYYDGFQAYFLREERKDEKLSPGNAVTLEMYGITEEYYNFVYDYILDYYPKVPIFSGPSANITTNVEPKERAVGIFTAYSVNRKTVTYK